MAKTSVGEKVLSNFIWRFAERCGAQLVTFVVSIILARLIEPSVYGLIALVTVFISILQVFIDSGLGNALIQKKDADDLDFSTVFYTNIIFCAILYILLFFISPAIALFYKMPELTSVIRVLGITIIISGIKNVQQAYVSRHMQFKRFFFATLGGTIGAAIVGIVMAYMGKGVWALVAQNLFNVVVDTLILWLTVKWRPQKAFSFKRLKKLYSFGWRLLISSLINTIYNDIRQLIIGKMYTSESLAFYNKGKQIPNLVVTNINSSIDSVLFPAMSASQDSKETVKRMTRIAVRVSSFLMWPIMIGLAVVATPLVRLLLAEKWLGCVPFLRVFCIALAFQPIHTANLNAIKALGRSDLHLKMEIIKKTMGILILFIAMNYGVMAICYSVLLYNIIAQIINTAPNKKLLGYSYFEQLKDIIPFVCLSLIMGILVWCIGLLHLPDLLEIFLQIIVGVIVYILEAYFLRLDVFFFVLDEIKGILHKKENTEKL